MQSQYKLNPNNLDINRPYIRNVVDNIPVNFDTSVDRSSYEAAIKKSRERTQLSQTQLKLLSDRIDANRDYYITYKCADLNKDTEHSLSIAICGNHIQALLHENRSNDTLISTLEHEILLLGRLETGNMSVGTYNKCSCLFRRRNVKGVKKFNRYFALYLALYLALKIDTLLESDEDTVFLIDGLESYIGFHSMYHANDIVTAKVLAEHAFRKVEPHEYKSNIRECLTDTIYNQVPAESLSTFPCASINQLHGKVQDHETTNRL